LVWGEAEFGEVTCEFGLVSEVEEDFWSEDSWKSGELDEEVSVGEAGVLRDGATGGVKVRFYEEEVDEVGGLDFGNLGVSSEASGGRFGADEVVAVAGVEVDVAEVLRADEVDELLEQRFGVV